MTIIDGKALAEKIISGLHSAAGRARRLSLAAVVVGGDATVRKFIERKKSVAGELGVDFKVYECPVDISTSELRKRIAVIVHDANPDGIIIQLPLPPHINRQHILNGVPPEKDVDVLSARAVGDFSVGKSKIMPPVVGAIKAIFDEYGIDYRSKRLLVVGAGALVGKPVAVWLANEKATFTVADENTQDISALAGDADIIISGAGKPGLITGNIIKGGAVIIDAGTSESGGKIMGDVDFESASRKASYITPVPGGVGPLTVAMIYKNLFALAGK